MKVIFRKDKETNDIIAFFPEHEAKMGCIICYQHIGQHGEASLQYYYNHTIPAAETEYNELYQELETVYDDCKLKVVKKIMSHNWY